jgi:hypothetical protein
MSDNWQVRVARGWRDTDLPPDVGRVLETHRAEGKRAVFSLHADSHAEGLQESFDLILYDGSGPNDFLWTPFQLFDHLLAQLENEKVDVASVLFVNFQPMTFSHTPRPEGERAVVPSALEGIRRFSQYVTGSLQVQGLWSTCEWALLSFERYIEA